MTIVDYYQSGNLVLPSRLLFHYKDIFSSADDFLVWQFCYLQSTTRVKEILPSQMAESLGRSVDDINRSLSRLVSQDLLAIKTIELAGEIDTIFDPMPALEKLDQVLQPSQESSNLNQPGPVLVHQGLKDLVQDFEREFGRPLSPFELEDLQKTLKEDRMEPALVREALKEAVFNRKVGWNYIQAILRNWRQKGLLTRQQYDQSRQEREAKAQQPQAMDDDLRLAMGIFSD